MTVQIIRPADRAACSIEGCDKHAKSRGFCNPHYQQYRRSGAFSPAPKSRCSVEGCARPYHGNGFCRPHGRRYRQFGDPEAGRAIQGEHLEWLEAHIHHDGDECLIWPWYRNNKGYAAVHFAGTTAIASRVMCTIANGEAPSPNMEAAHSCGNGAGGCVHPRHLSWRTPIANQRDKYAHGTHNRGERCGTAKLSEAQVREILALKGTMSQREIARRYEVNQQQISRIHTGKRWGWIEGAGYGD